MKKYQWFGILCGGLCLVSASAQTIVDSFEYASDDELLAAWLPGSGNTVLTTSDTVAPGSSSTKSMRVDFNFGSSEWATEVLRGVELGTELVIPPTSYVTFRLRGDPAFSVSDFRNLYLYAYDADGNFGRWGGATPANADWQIVNHLASSMEKPWDSTALPDLSRIVRLAFFQYGSQAKLDPYTATIYIDELTIRDTPLVEFPAPSAPRTLIDDFEGYSNDDALRAFYSYRISPAATIATASLETPAPQGNKALKLAINFAGGQWPWGSVMSPKVAPFSMPTNAVVSLRVKGDPSLASIADAGTVFYVSFYDSAERVIHYTTDKAPVVSSDWITLQAPVGEFWGDTTTIDMGNLVQWRILVEGWEGTADTTEGAGTFYVDDITIAVPPAELPRLTIVRQAGGLMFGMHRLVSGKTYELRTTADFTQWTTATTVTATSETATWTIDSTSSKAFYQLVQKSSP